MFKSRSTTQKKCAKRHRFAISKLYFPRSRNDRCVFHLSFLFLLLLYPPPSTTHQIYISPKPHNHTACHKPQVTSVNTAIHPFGTFDFWQKLFNVRSKYKLGFATRGLTVNLDLATRKSVTELCQKIAMCSFSNLADWKNCIKDEFPFCFGHLRLGSCSDTIFPPPSRHVV